MPSLRPSQGLSSVPTTTMMPVPQACHDTCVPKWQGDRGEKKDRKAGNPHNMGPQTCPQRNGPRAPLFCLRQALVLAAPPPTSKGT